MAGSVLDKLNTAADELMKFIPEDKRAEARAHYSRLQDAASEVQTVATRQHQWWEGNKDAVAERDRLRTELSARPAAAAAPAVDQNAIQAALDKQKAELLETGLAITTTSATIAVNHYNEFKEPIDMVKLTRDAIAANQPLDVFYNSTVAQRRAERATAERKESDERIREEGRQAGLAEGLKRIPGGALPYPVGGNAPTTTLAGLKKGEGGATNPDYTLDAAVATANAVMSGQR